VYEILDKNGEPTGECFEIIQLMKDPPLDKHPESGESCRRAVACPNIKHTGPAWNWCESSRRYVNQMKPKYIRGPDGKRHRYPKGGV